MIHSKNKSGFTLLETLFAMSIIAAIISPLFFMQAEVLRRVIRASYHIKRIFYMHDFLFNAQQQLQKETTQFTLEKQVGNPATVLRYVLKAVDKKSSLSAVQGIYVEQVTAVWTDFFNNQHQEDRLLTFRCIIPEQPS